MQIARPKGTFFENKRCTPALFSHHDKTRNCSVARGNDEKVLIAHWRRCCVLVLMEVPPPHYCTAWDTPHSALLGRTPPLLHCLWHQVIMSLRGLCADSANLSSFSVLRSSQVPSGKTMHFIGPLNAHGVWIATEDSNLVVYQPIRAQEMIVYKRLLVHHTVPTRQLENPIVLNPRYVASVQMFHFKTFMNRT